MATSINAWVKGKVHSVFYVTTKKGQQLQRMQVVEIDNRGAMDLKEVKLWGAEGVFKAGQDIDIPVYIKSFKTDSGAFGLDINYFHKGGTVKK